MPLPRLFFQLIFTHWNSQVETTYFGLGVVLVAFPGRIGVEVQGRSLLIQIEEAELFFLGRALPAGILEPVCGCHFDRRHSLTQLQLNLFLRLMSATTSPQA